MKKVVFTAVLVGLAAFTSTLVAQDDKGMKGEKGDKGNKETQEIIIRKKGEKDSKIVVELKGDDVTINGQPLSEFKDDEITINKRKIIIRDGQGGRYGFAPGDFEGMNFWNDHDAEPSAFLGVTTDVYHDGSKNSKPAGAEIKEVSKESAAEKAGLQKGDIIYKINDKKVEDPSSLSDVVTSFKPKDEVTVYYKRDGKEKSTKATLGERKVSKSMAYSFSGPDGMTRSFTMPRIQGSPKIELRRDRELGDMSPRIWNPGSGNYFDMMGDAFPRQQKLGLKVQDTEDGNGVKVLDVEKDSPAEKAGIQKDDILTEIAGKKVSNTDDVRTQLHEQHEKSAYNIKATRGGKTKSFDIKIPKKLKTANL